MIKVPVVSWNNAFELLAFAAVDGKAPLATGEDDDDEVPGKHKHETWKRGIEFCLEMAYVA